MVKALIFVTSKQPGVLHGKSEVALMRCISVCSSVVAPLQAKYMYLKEFMPAPANATELTELGGQAMFKVLDKLFSVVLESSDIDATCGAINHLLPGQHPPRRLLALAKQICQSSRIFVAAYRGHSGSPRSP